MTTDRRAFLKQSVAAGVLGASAVSRGGEIDPEVKEEMASRLKHLSSPQGTPPALIVSPSPHAPPFQTSFFQPCVPAVIFALPMKDHPKAKADLTLEELARLDRRLPDEHRRRLSDRDQFWLARFWGRFAAAAASLAEIGVDLGDLPDPFSHQRFFEFKPEKFYALWEVEFRWKFHEAYGNDCYNWGFASFCEPSGACPTEYAVHNFAKYDDCQFRALRECKKWTRSQDGVVLNLEASSPGPSIQAFYGEPILVRRINALPEILNDEADNPSRRNVKFAMPSTTTHLHNAHTASESDGHPNDWIETGEYWDHHYGNFPSGFDAREKLSTLWYHDHRMDFTAANVYAGLDGFYMLHDELRNERGEELPLDDLQDVGDETKGWNLPSGQYDVPMILHDLVFARPCDRHDPQTSEKAGKPAPPTPTPTPTRKPSTSSPRSSSSTGSTPTAFSATNGRSTGSSRPRWSSSRASTGSASSTAAPRGSTRSSCTPRSRPRTGGPPAVATPRVKSPS